MSREAYYLPNANCGDNSSILGRKTTLFDSYARETVVSLQLLSRHPTSAQTTERISHYPLLRYMKKQNTEMK